MEKSKKLEITEDISNINKQIENLKIKREKLKYKLIDKDEEALKDLKLDYKDNIECAKKELSNLENHIEECFFYIRDTEEAIKQLIKEKNEINKLEIKIGGKK